MQKRRPRAAFFFLYFLPEGAGKPSFGAPAETQRQRFRWGEEEQGSGRSFRCPWAKTKQSGLCDDEVSPEGEFLSAPPEKNQKPVLLPEGSGKSSGLSGPAPTVRPQFRLRASFFRHRPKGTKSPFFCRKVPANPVACRVPPRQAGYFLLHQRKYPKSVHRGRTPYVPPCSVGVRPSLSGVRDPRLRRFPRRPPGSCSRMLWCLRPRIRAWPGAALWHGAPLEVQARRLEHQDQAPIGGAEDCRSTAQKAGGRRASLGVSAGVRRK